MAVVKYGGLRVITRESVNLYIPGTFIDKIYRKNKAFKKSFRKKYFQKMDTDATCDEQG